MGPKAKETAHFVDMMDKFFDCLNCRSLSGGKRSRNPFKSPYRSGTDWKPKYDVAVVQVYFSSLCSDCSG